MRQATGMGEYWGSAGAAPKHAEQQSCGRDPERPAPQLDIAKRYLELLADGDILHIFQPYYDPDRHDQRRGWMARGIYGRLSDVWSKLVELQQKGVEVAVTMAETDGRGRKEINMLRPRTVWIDADGPLLRDLPLPITIIVETSPGKGHYIYVCWDLDWELWHGLHGQPRQRRRGWAQSPHSVWRGVVAGLLSQTTMALQVLAT